MKLWIMPLPHGTEHECKCGYAIERRWFGGKRCDLPADNLVYFGGLWVWRCDEHIGESNDFGKVRVLQVLDTNGSR